MATANFDWRKRQQSDGQEREVVEGYIITDAANAAAAYAATGFPVNNQELTPGSPFRVATRQMAPGEGPTTFIGTVIYREGNFDWTSDPNPLSREVTIDWDLQTREEETDRDGMGEPYWNSASVLYDPLPTTTLKSWILTITRNEPFWDLSFYAQFIDTVNSNTFSLSDGSIVKAGDAYCHVIKPATSYSPSAPYIPIQFVFEVREAIRPSSRSIWNGTDALNPFDRHEIDRSRIGIGQIGPATVRGPFVLPSGEPVETDVLLDGTGKPLYAATYDAKLKVNIGGYYATPVSITQPSFIQLSPYSITGSDPKLVVLFKQMKQRSNFAAIGL